MDSHTEYFVLVDSNLATEMTEQDCPEHLMCGKVVFASVF